MTTENAKVLKLLSALLDYPEHELQGAQQELLSVIEADNVLSGSSRERLYTWVQQFCTTPIEELQEAYIDLFDRGRSHSLLLFEHVHGESRDRGQAMVDLMALYERNGYQLGKRELPDYIPLFLEYLSQRPLVEIQDALANVAHILAVLAERMQRRESRYTLLFELLLEVAGEEVDRDSIRAQVGAEKPDHTPEALDKVWEEEAVTFGGNAISGGCPTSGTNTGVPADRTVGNIDVRTVRGNA